MRVYGVEVSTVVIDHALSQMELHRGFTYTQLTEAVDRAGGGYQLGVASRAADRALQKLRRIGAIAFKGGKWFAVKAEETP